MVIWLAIPAALGAAGAAWLANGKLMYSYGNRAVIYLGPAVEETLKTGLAVLVGAPILLTHVFFGLFEGLWEYTTCRRGKIAAVASILTHLVYGLIALMVYGLLGIIPAILAAYLAHLLWNYWLLS